MDETVNRNVSYLRTCPMCGKVHTVYLSKEESDAYEEMLELRARRKPSPLIQEALPNLPVEDREALMSGYCKECQKLLFGTEEPAYWRQGGED